jgi:ribosome-binding factor A
MGRQRETDETRTERLQELIREEVNFLLRSEVGDARLDGAEITMVELSPEGARARLWFTVEDGRELGDVWDGVAGFLRARLAESLGLKRTPELRFRRDPATRRLLGAEGEVV